MIKKIEPEKLINRYGNKGIVSRIEDDIIPRTKDGQPIEVIPNITQILNRLDKKKDR